ncbi:MAG TPA: GNAT family N-acetyltransferase [Cyclobacteriaceae bacterium]|nr:GNAT family N-acetyltransferase [Cyclobacteriaceae bacterium]
MDYIPFKLETNRLILMEPNPSYAEKVLAYFERNRHYFEPWMPALPPDFYSIKKQEEFLKEDLELIQHGSQRRFFIFKKEDAEHIIGDFLFSNIIHGPLQSCFLGYKISQSESNKGYTTEALEAGINFMFEKLRLHRIEANIIPRNAPSIRVIEKLGFVKEGFSKEYLKINGKWEDHYRFAKVNGEK